MIIDPQSISYQAIKQDILTYIQTKEQKWQDYYAGSAGTILIELLSGVAAYHSFTTISNRRETYLLYGEKRSSAVGIAQNLGYSAFRGRNKHIKIKVLNVTSGTVSLIPFQVIGLYDNEYDIIVTPPTGTDQYNIPSGETVDIEVTIGNLKEENIRVPTEDLTIFRFESSDVSDDIQLKLITGDTTKIIERVSNEIPNLLNDYYIAISNALGGVDVMYFNTATYGRVKQTASTAINYTDTPYYLGLTAPVDPGTVKIQINVTTPSGSYIYTGVDDGNGYIIGNWPTPANYNCGTIDYISGATTINFYDNISGISGIINVEYYRDLPGLTIAEPEWKYSTGDLLVLNYVGLANAGTIEESKVIISDTTIAFDSLVETVLDYQEPEEVGSIRVNAPFHHETQLIIRGRDDFKKELKLIASQLVGDVKDANAKDLDPAEMAITLVRLDEDGVYEPLTESEKSQIVIELESHRPFGVRPIAVPLYSTMFPDAVEVPVDLTIEIKLATTLEQAGGQAQVESDVAAIVDDYEYILEASLTQSDLYDIEYELESLDYIKVARVVPSGPSTLDWNEFYNITVTVSFI